MTTTTAARCEGHVAYKNGEAIENNPYSYSEESLREAWQDGFVDGVCADRVEDDPLEEASHALICNLISD